MFTMCYAMIGIPLGLVMFQSIGERVNRLSSFIIQTVRKSMHCKKTTATELDLICVVTTLSSLTIAGGAYAFSKFENWRYFDSVYYCFITLTTIGFGDMVALQRDNSLNTRPEYVMFALIFILFGLAIVAASLNLLVLRFVTMNTEDERRDEAEAQQAAQGAVRLEGDVITSNGSILSGHLGHRIHIDHSIQYYPQLQHQDSSSLDGDNHSMCSCSCGCFRASRHRHKRYHVRKPNQVPFYIQPMPKPRFDFRDINRERLKKISLSSSSLPPVGLFPTEDKSNKIPAITDGMYNYYSSQDNINDDIYNFYNNDKAPELRHQSLEYFDDFYPIENQFLFDPLDDDDDDNSGPPPQMTTTTTIASFKCQTHTQQTTVTIYKTHNRASSL
ncbi:hypothetical protein ACKWTF_004511 [Chironomus riparius]